MARTCSASESIVYDLEASDLVGRTLQSEEHNLFFEMLGGEASKETYRRRKEILAGELETGWRDEASLVLHRFFGSFGSEHQMFDRVFFRSQLDRVFETAPKM